MQAASLVTNGDLIMNSAQGAGRGFRFAVTVPVPVPVSGRRLRSNGYERCKGCLEK